MEDKGWLTESQFIDGLAMGGVLPAPLIIFSTFVGYVAGGPAGGIAITLGVFLPAFVFPIFLHRRLVAVAENPLFRPFLLGVAAGVIGLIAAVRSTSSTPESSMCRRRSSLPARSLRSTAGTPSSPCCGWSWAAERSERCSRRPLSSR